MTHKYIILAFYTLTLTACTSNQKPIQNSNKSQTIDTITEVENNVPLQQEFANDSSTNIRTDTIVFTESESDLDSLEMELDLPIAYRAAKKIGFVSSPNDGYRKNDYHYIIEPSEDDIGDWLSFNIICFPFNTGGYLVLSGHDYDTGYDYYGGHKYVTAIKYNSSFIYKNNEITEIDFKLPICPLSELLDSSKCEGLENDIKIMDSIYTKYPFEIMSYNINAIEKELEILYALYYDSDLRNKKEYLLKIGETNNLPKYKWNGEQFVRQ